MQFKRKLKRYMFALVMLVLSAYATIFIKNYVDSLNPEKSLPIINVTVGGYNQPAVARAGYTWKFGTGLAPTLSPYISAEDVPLMTTDCSPGEVIVINFSAPCELITLYETQGLANNDFKQLYTWQTPMEEGVYVYKIQAEFEKGDILYYFALQVKQHNLMQ
ncbi:MAG: hypothetical protein IJN77_00485 [Oscillospiraceae bacterium]|nr:hypothetical protein [Oscillospiraceae bacterium]MBR6610387.1 hypothetical protein [Oscillospiraceae bacterium]